MMKIKNWIENILIAVIVCAFAFLLFNELKFKPMKRQFENQIETQNQLIESLSKIEKYSIENKFDKNRNKKSVINLNVEGEISDSRMIIDSIKNASDLDHEKRFFEFLRRKK